MIIGRLDSRARTTVPRAVRDALRLEPGDTLAYDIVDGGVILTKAEHSAADARFATFGEWWSDADARAYAGL